MQARWPLVAWFVSLWVVSDSRSVFPSRRAESSLQWRHNGHNGVSNHRRLDCLLNCLFRRRSKKTSKLRVTGLCERNSPVIGEFPSQRASNAENVSIWWLPSCCTAVLLCVLSGSAYIFHEGLHDLRDVTALGNQKISGNNSIFQMLVARRVTWGK